MDNPCLATATRHLVRLPDPILVGVTWIGSAIARPPRRIPLELHLRSFMMPSSIVLTPIRSVVRETTSEHSPQSTAPYGSLKSSNRHLCREALRQSLRGLCPFSHVRTGRSSRASRPSCCTTSKCRDCLQGLR